MANPLAKPSIIKWLSSDSLGCRGRIRLLPVSFLPDMIRTSSQNKLYLYGDAGIIFAISHWIMEKCEY